MQTQFFGLAKADTLTVGARDGNFPWPIRSMTNRAQSAVICGVMILGMRVHLPPPVLRR